MWWVGSKHVDIYIGTRAFAVCGAGETPVVVEVDGFEEALGALGKWAGEAPARRRVRLWLSGGLCRPFIVPAVDGVTGQAETAAIAATLAPQHTGLPGPCAVFVERGAASEPIVAIAVRAEQLAQIHACLDAQVPRHRIVSIRPWWVDVLRCALLREPALAALGVQDCDSMTVLTGREAGAFEGAATYTPVLDRNTAQSVLRRAMLSVDVAQDREMGCRFVIGAPIEREATPALAFGALTEFSR